METRPYTEGLAEYYLGELLGGGCFNGKLREYVQLYGNIPGATELSPRELYLKALQKAGPAQ